MANAPDFHAPILDSLYHDLWATRFAQGEMPQEPYFRAPLYPTLLGCVYKVFGRDPFIPRVLGILFGMGTAGLVLAIGSRIFGRGVGILSASILILYRPFIYHETELLIPATLIFLLMLALWNLVRCLERPEFKVRWLLTGVCFGLAAIARPNVLMFMPVLVFWLLWRERKRAVIPVIVLTLGTIVAIAPVTVRNYIVGRDRVLIASQGGINFYIGNNPESDGYTAKTPLGYNWHGDYEDSVALYAKRRAEKIAGRPMKPSEISKFWFQEGMRFWREHPGTAIGLLLKKTYLFWNAYEIKNNKNMYFQTRYSPVLQLPLLSFGVVSILGVIGMAIWWGKSLRATGTRDAVSGTPFVLILYLLVYMGSVVAFFVCDRYRLPVVPVLALFGAYGAMEVCEAVHGRAWRTLTRMILAALVLGVLLHIDPYHVRPKDYAEDHWSAANCLQQTGRYEQSIEEYQAALTLRPNYLEAWNNLGSSLYALGLLEQARDAYAKALDVNSEYPNAHNNLAQCFLALNDPEQALPHAERAVELMKGNAVHRNTLGECYEALGRNQEALKEYASAVVLHPNYAIARQKLAGIYLKLEQPRRALDEYQKALELNPQSSVAAEGVKEAKRLLDALSQ